MRVIAGEFRSRLLKTLPGMETRPTPDRLRETLFNIIAAEVPGTLFIDAYAGTGAVGIEALSRGAKRAVFLERSRAAATVIRDNLHALGLIDRAEVVQGKVLVKLAHFKPDIVFLDPPYELAKEYNGAMEQLGAAPPSLVIAQHASRRPLAPQYGDLLRTRELRQGDNTLSFYRPRASEAAPAE